MCNTANVGLYEICTQQIKILNYEKINFGTMYLPRIYIVL